MLARTQNRALIFTDEASFRQDTVFNATTCLAFQSSWRGSTAIAERS